MLGFSPVQILIVLVIALLVFGAARLPEVGRNLGRGLREFRGAITGEADQEPSAASAGAVEVPESDVPPWA